MKEPSSLEDNILYQIGEAQRLAHKKVTSSFSEQGFDVTVEQFGVLALLWYKEGVNQQDIADGLNRDKTTIARIIENMVNRSLIVKVPDQIDKRNKLIYLTQKGKSLQKDMVESAGTVYYQALNNISSTDLENCLKTMKQITKNLK
jgi:DNA-binding MarR family transcriptional regulator